MSPKLKSLLKENLIFMNTELLPNCFFFYKQCGKLNSSKKYTLLSISWLTINFCSDQRYEEYQENI